MIVTLIFGIISCSSKNPTGSVNLTHKLVAYYPFNGNANDESGNGNNGIVSGASLTTDRFGNPNRAYRFDGNDDYIDCGNGSSLNFEDVMTVSAWMKWDLSTNVNKFSAVLSKQEYSGYGMSIYNAHVYFSGYINSEGGKYKEAKSNDPLTPGIWYHLVGTYDGNTVKLYFDGVLQAETTLISGQIKICSLNLFIGANPEVQGSHFAFFHGDIDDVRFYQRA